MSGAVAFASAAAASGAGSTIIADPLLTSDLAASTATAAIRYNPDGSYQTIAGSDILPAGNWVSPVGSASQWEIRATVTAGATPTGASVGAWLALSSSRTWTLTRTATGVISSTLTFEFRPIGGATAATVTGNSIEVEVI